MSARAIAPDPIHREKKPNNEVMQSPAPPKNTTAQDIANLAYALWQRRGCPQGSAERDWLEAEELIRSGQQK